MAGGGYGRGSGLPLSERVRLDQPRPTPVPIPPPLPSNPGRHCWINVPVDGGSRRPGLLVEWRKDAAGQWEGRVAYVAELRRGRWAVVDEWLPAAALTTTS